MIVDKLPFEIVMSCISDGNMQFTADDSTREVIQNRTQFLTTNNMDMQKTTLCRITYDREDYAQYKQLDRQYGGLGMFSKEEAQPYDALFTADDTTLFLPLADCQAGVFYDKKVKVIGLAHLGRHSVEQRGAAKLVTYMQKTFGSSLDDIIVWLGPSPEKDTYPLWKRDNMSLREANVSDLLAAGMPLNNIKHDHTDTTKDIRYFSHSEFLKGRRQTDGRYAIAVRLHPDSYLL